MFFHFQPVFLTKEQRATEALKRRQEEVDKIRKQQDAERKIIEQAQASRQEELRRDDREYKYVYFIKHVLQYLHLQFL